MSDTIIWVGVIISLIVIIVVGLYSFGFFSGSDDDDNNGTPPPSNGPPPPSTPPPAGPPAASNRIHSGDVVTIKNNGSLHFESEDRYLNTDAAGNGMNTGNSCSGSECNFMIVKFNKVAGSVVKDRTTEIANNDYIKIYSLDRNAAMVGATPVQFPMVPDACISAVTSECPTWDEWKIQGSSITYGAPVSLINQNIEATEVGKGHLNFTSSFGSGPNFGQAGPVRYKEWILTKVDGVSGDTLLQTL